MITLNTTIWEGDFDQILDEKSWFLNYKSNNVKEKTLIINNVRKESRDKLLSKIKNAQKNQNINIVYVDEYKEEAKRFFNLNIDESTPGYVYTIQYFVALLKCNQPYIFNVSSDCELFFKEEYLNDSIEALQSNQKAITTTLPWSEDIRVSINEQNQMYKYFGKPELELEKFYYSVGFSDQTFFGDVSKLRNVNYNTTHPNTEHFPAYGGNSFEKRLCSYFLNQHSYRLVYKKYHYIHHVPKTRNKLFRIIRKIKKILNIHSKK